MQIAFKYLFTGYPSHARVTRQSDYKQAPRLGIGAQQQIAQAAAAPWLRDECPLAFAKVISYKTPAICQATTWKVEYTYRTRRFITG